MNKQEIFNKVYTHLLQQNEKAINKEAYSCKYRGPNGLKCAAGCLIPDNLYDPKMEGLKIGRVLDHWPDLNTVLGIQPNDLGAVEFLNALQNVHDNHEVYGWSEALQKVAKKYELAIPS